MSAVVPPVHTHEGHGHDHGHDDHHHAMPSGWHLLGRTPVKTFVATREPPVLFVPGDEVVFEPVEAARVDGASEWQILRHVTIPMVMPVILTAVILRLIDALKTFDIIFAMTGGGPGYASETLNILGFKYSFEYFRMGQSSVILVVLFLVVFLCSLLIMKLRASSEH